MTQTADIKSADAFDEAFIVWCAQLGPTFGTLPC
jgi:hypothetical protein